MTEEDTFLKLKRLSYEELGKIIERLSDDEFHILVGDSSLKEEFLNAHGWNSIEFDQETRKLYV